MLARASLAKPTSRAIQPLCQSHSIRFTTMRSTAAPRVPGGSQRLTAATTAAGSDFGSPSGGGGAVGSQDQDQDSLRTVVWDVGGNKTEVLELPPLSGGTPEVQALLIPGNPGAAPFYGPFMRSLQRQLGDRAAVAAVSNLGMDGLGLTPPGRVFSLEDQIRHKVQLLRQRYVGPGRPPLVLLGHSIGTYMAIHAVHRLENHHLASSQAAAAAIDSVAQQEWQHPDPGHGAASMEAVQAELVAAQQQQQQAQQAQGAVQAQQPAAPHGQPSGGGSSSSQSSSSSNVVKVIGLFPFLQVDPDCRRQRRLHSLTAHHTLVARLAGSLGKLPAGARRGLVRLVARSLDPHAVDVVAKVFTSRTNVENGLYMGMTEFETLAAPADWWLLRQLGPRFALFVAPGDTWFKQWKWDAMHREMPGGVESYWVDTHTHDFCVSERQSEDLAARIAPIVQTALQQQQHSALVSVPAAPPKQTIISRL